MHKKCYEGHPPLVIGEYKVYGGSCSNPLPLDADVYVSLDYSARNSSLSLPWSGKYEFRFLIPDMGVPSDPDQFKTLIAWLHAQVSDGKKVHIGCIGGHGRTGMVLAALVTMMTGNLDSITYVRENYCTKAVESASQVEFLNRYFDITRVKGAKAYSHDSWGFDSPTTVPARTVRKAVPPPPPLTASKGKGVRVHVPVTRAVDRDLVMTATPQPSTLCIWSTSISFDKPEAKG